MVILAGIIFTYLVGLSPAIVIRFVYPGRPLIKKGKLKYFGVFISYYIGLIILFVTLAHLSDTKYIQSIHLIIATFISCYILFNNFSD